MHRAGVRRDVRDVGRQDVRIGFEVVGVEAVEVFARHRRRQTVEPRQTVIRRVVGALVEVAQSEPRRTVETERQARRDAPALALGDVAAGDFGCVRHRIDAQRGAGAELRERPIVVGRDAPRLVVAAVDAHRRQRLERGPLRPLIDHTAGRAAAEDRGRRALQHLDRLDVERVARIAAEVAHAVQEQVVARVEAADVRIVALPAELAGAERDAGHGAQRVVERDGGAVVEQLLRDLDDRLRRIAQRFRELEERAFADAITRVLLVLYDDLLDVAAAAVGRGARRSRRLSPNGAQGEGDPCTDAGPRHRACQRVPGRFLANHSQMISGVRKAC